MMIFGLLFRVLTVLLMSILGPIILVVALIGVGGWALGVWG